MIPVQLTISGIYSYVQPVTIDFQPLVDAKLFGIFGPVGSGKSTILEAIMFVLFDRTNRLNKAGDDRYYNMMNLQSREMCIDFIFMAGHNHENKYRFYFLARRSSKDFQKVEVKDRSYYQWVKSDWKPLDKPDVLGMTYENFMQTVIIPQGKFREFIDQKPAARTLMLKELFHLDRFDIASKAFHQLAVVKDQHSFVEGQLSQFEELNKTVLKQLSKEINTISSDIEKNTVLESRLTKESNLLQLLQHIHQELMEVSDTVSTLESEKQFFQKKQHQLTRFLKIKEVFQDRIAKQMDLLHQAKSRKEELMEAISIDKQLTKEVKNANGRWQKAQAEFTHKDQIQQQIDDLQCILEIKDLKEQLNATLHQKQQLDLSIEEISRALQALELDLKKTPDIETAKQQAQSELHQLVQLKGWWTVHMVNKKQLNSLKQEITDTEEQINTIVTAQDKLSSKLDDEKQIKSKIEESQEQLRSLLVHNDWRTHARHLEKGKPCPLCGSVDHPKPLSSKSLEPDIIAARKQLSTLEDLLDQQRQLAQEVKIQTTKVVEKQQALQMLGHKFEIAEAEYIRHQKTYPGEIAPSDYPVDLPQAIEQHQLQIEGYNKELDLQRSKQERLQEVGNQRQELMLRLPVIISEKEKLQGKVEQLASMVKMLDYKVYQKKSSQQLEQMASQLEDKIQSIDLNYKIYLDQLTKSEQKLNQHKGQLQSLEQQITRIKVDADRLEVDLLKDCQRESLKGLKEVQKILALGLDPKVEQQELEQYTTDLKAAKIRQQALLKKMDGKRYHVEKHRQLTQQLEDVKLVLKQLSRNLSNKQFTLEQYQTRLKKKDTLKEDLQKLTDRRNNVQEICNLLRGNGFINFISSVYLQNLCKSANLRFTKLTGNSLSLELSPQNEFMVRDHLNNGKLRLLKTLSGGQIFQASLSLALSLAENVKDIKQADQSFFFLDEGFGSLDRISLQMVFESLKALQQENRIVGIISHVEDLQTEIDTFLSVEQHPEKGSLVHSSWLSSVN